MIGQTVKVIVDRPLGSAHPNYQNTIYPINYGYIPEIFAADGELQDAYILGVDEPVKEFTGKVIAVIQRENDIESKWVVASEEITFSEKEIREKTNFQEKYFKISIKL